VEPVGESASPAVARPAADREPSAEWPRRPAAVAWSQPGAAPESLAIAPERAGSALRPAVAPVARPVLRGPAALAADLAGWAAPIAQEAEPASPGEPVARMARPALPAGLMARVAGLAWRAAELGAPAEEPALREARPVLQEASAVSEERRAGVVSPEESAAPAALPAWLGEEQIAPEELVAEPAWPEEEQIQAARRAAGLAAAGDRRAARELLQDGGAPRGDRTSRPALAAALRKSSHPIGVPPRCEATPATRAPE